MEDKELQFGILGWQLPVLSAVHTSWGWGGGRVLCPGQVTGQAFEK